MAGGVKVEISLTASGDIESNVLQRAALGGSKPLWVKSRKMMPGRCMSGSGRFCRGQISRSDNPSARSHPLLRA